MRQERLQSTIINVSYRGAVNLMHSTTIKDVVAYRATLSVGQVQSMIFKDDQICPFWMDAQARLDSKYEKDLGGTVVEEKIRPSC